jgi:hypothetical protein
VTGVKSGVGQQRRVAVTISFPQGATPSTSGNANPSTTVHSGFQNQFTVWEPQRTGKTQSYPQVDLRRTVTARKAFIRPSESNRDVTGRASPHSTPVFGMPS